MKLFGSKLPPVSETSVFHPNNQRVDSNKIVMDAAKFFERHDRSGRSVKVIGSLGTKQKRFRSR